MAVLPLSDRVGSQRSTIDIERGVNAEFRPLLVISERIMALFESRYDWVAKGCRREPEQDWHQW
jgi:hypothetical protein